jgi:GNAT superfamily N-acetyltransferase
MTTDVIVNELVEEEKEVVQKLLVGSYQQFKEGFNDPIFWEKYVNGMVSSVDNPYVDKILVAKHKGEILGTVQLFETAEKAYDGESVDIQAPFIRLLAVHPKARGLGIGQELMKACVQYAKQKDSKSIYLFTGDIMVAAIRLYEKCGFARDLEEEEKNRQMNVICYRLDLYKS